MRCRCRADRHRRPPTRRGAAILALWLATACGDGTTTGEPVRVTIPAGATFGAAAESLAKAGVVDSPKLFRAYAWVTGNDRDLKAGTYLLRPGIGWGELLDDLTAGRGIAHTVTIPEGYALRQIVPLLADKLHLPEDSLAAAVRDTALLRRLNIPTPTVEGYLFPETYTFSAGAGAREVVDAMVDEFERRWRPEWDERLQALAMSRHDIVTLASIVEEEAQIAEERPVIAAVYHNRLRRGMLLQADPTVQYARGAHTSRVLYKDLEIDSHYNTYRYPGLPPGPIASPGTASIDAALFPANVPYLFFVAHPDGHHEFHTTFEGHTQARQEIRRARQRSNRGATRGGR